MWKLSLWVIVHTEAVNLTEVMRGLNVHYQLRDKQGSHYSLTPFRMRRYAAYDAAFKMAPAHLVVNWLQDTFTHWFVYLFFHDETKAWIPAPCFGTRHYTLFGHSADGTERRRLGQWNIFAWENVLPKQCKLVHAELAHAHTEDLLSPHNGSSPVSSEDEAWCRTWISHTVN